MDKKWKIKNAKQGDFIYTPCDGKISVFKEFCDKDKVDFWAYVWCWQEEDDRTFETTTTSGVIDGNNARLATDSEIAMLYDKLQEWQYTWDEEKLEVQHLTPEGWENVEGSIEKEWMLALSYLETANYDDVIGTDEESGMDVILGNDGVIVDKSTFYQLARTFINIGYNLNQQ